MLTKIRKMTREEAHENSLKLERLVNDILNNKDLLGSLRDRPLIPAYEEHNVFIRPLYIEYVQYIVNAMIEHGDEISNLCEMNSDFLEFNMRISSEAVLALTRKFSYNIGVRIKKAMRQYECHLFNIKKYPNEWDRIVSLSYFKKWLDAADAVNIERRIGFILAKRKNNYG